jgi:histidinol phosphatase-like enzyme (inositol monophosphatase family)
MSPALDFAALEAFTLELAHVAGEAALPHFRAGGSIDDKGSPGAFDPVTEADRGAEAAIRRVIAERYPDHGVVGEEYGADRPDADLVWVLDPVDGTRAFVAGLPLWTTLIALKVEGRPAVGAIAQPYLGEVFLGGPAGGSRLRDRRGERPLRVRSCPRLTEAVISTTDPSMFDGSELGAWTQVRATSRLARLGLDAYAYAMVALGTVDLVCESGLKEWDWSALIPVIEHAGGAVTTWKGEAVDGSGRIAAAGDRRVLDDALVSLRRAI